MDFTFAVEVGWFVSGWLDGSFLLVVWMAQHVVIQCGTWGHIHWLSYRISSVGGVKMFMGRVMLVGGCTNVQVGEV